MVTCLQSTICQNSYSIFSKPTVRQEVFENTKKSVRLDALLYTELFRLLLRFHLGKAVAAINRTVFTGFERNFRFSAAGSAGRYVHLTLAAGRVFARITARFTSLGLIFKAAACIKLLLTGRENEFLAAFFADQGLVLVHSCSPLVWVKK